MPLDVLLTGKPPFQPNEDGTKQITDMRALLKDDVPDEWLSDSNTQNHDVEDPGPFTIEELLEDVLQKFFAAFAWIPRNGPRGGSARIMNG